MELRNDRRSGKPEISVRFILPLDHFIKCEGFDQLTIESKLGIDLYDRHAESKVDRVDYALPQLLIGRVKPGL